MKKIFIIIIATILFSSCNQSKIDSLSFRVESLKKDSIELNKQAQQQKFLVNSLQKRVKLDSLQLSKFTKVNKSNNATYECTYCGRHFSSMWDRCAMNTRGSYHVPLGGYSQFSGADIKRAMQGK